VLREHHEDDPSYRDASHADRQPQLLICASQNPAKEKNRLLFFFFFFAKEKKKKKRFSSSSSSESRG